jgi:hypothetical protein
VPGTPGRFAGLAESLLKAGFDIGEILISWLSNRIDILFPSKLRSRGKKSFKFDIESKITSKMGMADEKKSEFKKCLFKGLKGQKNA